MKYGHFEDAKREYVITNPRTPSPWINYLGNEAFYSLISNTGGGYSFYKDARLRRVTRYRYNNVPLDNTGKYFYINDGGAVWNPGWQPTQTELDAYECRHGLGYTKIKGEKDGLEAEVLTFVPLGFSGEVQQLTLTNKGSKKKSFKVYTYVEWCLWNALDDMTNFQRNLSTGEVEIEGSVLYHKTEYKERRDHYAFYSVNAATAGFDTDRESFIGKYNGTNRPDVVFDNQSKNSEAHGWSPIASHCLEVELEPGASQEFVFVLGFVQNPEDEKWESQGVINKTRAKSMIADFADVEGVNKGMSALAAHWDELLSAYQVKSGDERLDRMVNIWNPYQCMVTFNMSRSASYYESGIGRGMGFRDSNQDLIGCVHQVAERSRERILDIAATQFENGGAYHQYQPLTKRGNNEIGSNFNDDPMWLVLSVTEYIKETGDFAILDEQVPFENDESKADSLFSHLSASFNHVVEHLGPHKLPLIGRADWNDCLNLNCFSNNPDEPFQTTENKAGETAESVFIAAMFVLYGNEYVTLCRRTGKEDEASRAEKHVQAMVEAMDSHGWDGEWFLRAYDDSGDKIGGKDSDGSKIFIESQGFSVMAGVGVDDGRAEKALDSVKEYLDCDYGIVLNNPAFTKYHINLGEISTYPAGYKENAGIFCHNNPWIMIAETLIGRGDRAFEYYSKIAPAFLEEIQELHRAEPYVYAQMIAGKDAYCPGEAKNSWLTGTAAWNFYTISQYILGIRIHYDGIEVNPCIPSSWKGFKVTRKFRGATYEIEIQNPKSVSKGIAELLLNGEKIEGNVVPAQSPDATYVVTAIMG